MLLIDMINFIISIEERTGIKPDTVFVGYQEYEKLKGMVSDVVKDENGKVLEFWGCKLVYVTKQSYLGAGFTYV